MCQEPTSKRGEAVKTINYDQEDEVFSGWFRQNRKYQQQQNSLEKVQFEKEHMNSDIKKNTCVNQKKINCVM